MKTDKRITGSDCFTTDLSLVNCQTFAVCAYKDGNNSYEADILVKRGSGRADITGLRFVVKDNLGNEKVENPIDITDVGFSITTDYSQFLNILLSKL